MPAQCSKLFEEVCDAHRSCNRAECACGKIFFDGSSQSYWDWDPGEQESLREAAKDSSKCIELGSSVFLLHINGEDIVLGCDCDRAARYEGFLVREAARISEYFNKVAQVLRDRAARIAVPTDLGMSHAEFAAGMKKKG